MSDKPNLFLIGVPKAGTSALASFLANSEEIYMPEGRKEPKYFDAETYYDSPDDYPFKNLEEYLSLYEYSGTKKYRLDASVFNCYSAASISRILSVSPLAKFILVLRDPVECSVSMHKQRLKYHDPRMRELSTNFMECWKLIEDRKRGASFPDGCRNKFLFRYDLLYSYEDFIPSVINLIDENRLLIIFYEDLKRNFAFTRDEICEFLDIDKINAENKMVNPSVTVKRSILFDFIYSVYQKNHMMIKGIPFIDIIKIVIKKAQNTLIEQEAVDSSVEKSVYESFEKTFEYLDMLKTKK